MINCRMTIERLYPFLDRELSEQEILDVQEHLNRCPPCAKHFEYEQGVLRFVGTAGRTVCAPSELLDRILASRRATIE